MSNDFRTRFDLTYPPVPFNRTNDTYSNMSLPHDTGTEQTADGGGSSAILAGLFIPHVVCTLFVIARIWSRLVLLRKWFLDDTLILAAWIFSTAVCVVYSIAAITPNIRQAVIVTASISASDSPDSIEYDDEAIQPYMLRTYLGLIFYQLCLCLTKLSVLTFYLRMFYPRNLERRMAWATVIFVLLYGIPLLFISVFQCHPVAGQFFGKPMTCFSFTPLLIASASLHTATDAWLIVMVIPCIIRLDLPSRQKVALAVVLSLSVFVIAASLTRLQLSLHANYRPSGAGVQVANTLGFFVMTILECDIALICASAPTLRPLLAKMWPKMGFGDSSRGNCRGEEEDANSVNLTTVVSYHGYPWTEHNTPANRSKSNSFANVDVPAVPVPPVPAFHRTPTTLSLRSFMSSMAPRSRGMTIGDRGEDRTVLLKDEGGQESRRTSVGFEGYHDQYLGYGEEKKGRSRSGSKLSRLGHNRWGSSQESFVLGLNDPASPRMSPVAADFSTSTLAKMTTNDEPLDEKVDRYKGKEVDNSDATVKEKSMPDAGA